MQKVFLFTLCFLVFHNVFAQDKISFRDGNTMQIRGEKIATFEELEEGVVRKRIFQYAEFKDSTILISIHVVWASGNLDYLKCYSIKHSQLNEYSLSEVYETEIDEFNSQNYFRLPISTETETPFLYDEYTGYSSIPVQKSFNTFTIISTQKADLDLFKEKLTLFLPLVKN